MIRYFFIFLSLVTILLAKVDYTQMSNEELIALIGYVSKDKKVEFTKELEKRKSTFSEQEKALYQETLMQQDKNTSKAN